jgi:acetolactate synthase-1/3 small subunit
MPSRHTISVFVENLPGVLMRVAGLFARRGYNIESLAVGPTEHPQYSRMTIVVDVADRPVEQVVKQLNKLIPVVRVRELDSEDRVERELMLVKVKAPAGERSAVREVVEIFRARILDVSPESVVVEATGTPDKLDALEENLRPHGILELCRTGRIALERGPRTIGNVNGGDAAAQKE